MMGRRNQGQRQLFYEFRLDEAVPNDHLAREIGVLLDLSWVYAELAPCYSEIGRPSIDPFAPDKGESVNALIANPPPGAPVPPILPPKGGYLFLDKVKFAASFAGDVDPKTAAFMADSQVPWGLDALGGAVTEPAWKSKPSWYLQVRDDRMIPYPAQQFMAKRAGATVAEVPGSHAIYVSNPNAVAALIEQAANGVK